ncbi:MAG: hypothetical protein ACK2UK_01550, partial [Candidatus Promineifilaceae bacterium]
AAGGLLADNGNGPDDLGTPAAQLFSYGGGDLGGSVTDNLAGQPVSLAGGTLVVGSNGSWSLSGQPFQHGFYSFHYRLTNLAGGSDAEVRLMVKGPPVAQDDSLLIQVGSNYGQTGVLFKNNGSGADDRGTPLADVASFGGGSLGGDVTAHGPGETVSFAGGSLKVEADGTVTVDGTTTPGTYTFEYRIENGVDVSTATVTAVVAEPPNAQNDSYEFVFDLPQDVDAASGLFADNGSGADALGSPAAEVASFGGGSLGGTKDDHAAGSSANLAGGILTVNNDGSWTLTGEPFIPGVYKFSYVLQNVLTADTADVTLAISAEPDAKDDDFTVVAGETTTLPAGTLFENNGSGRDDLGFPVAKLESFGGGSLTGSVLDHEAGDEVAFGGGMLQINADGSLVLTNPTQVGALSFKYRIGNSLGVSDATVSIYVSARPLDYKVMVPVTVP